MSITLDQAKDALWRRGVLFWKAQDHQLPVYEFISGADGADHTRRLVYVHRQFGKSFLSLLHATEVALQAKRTITVFAPTQRMLRAILLPNMETLLEDCPPDLRPSFSSLDNVFSFPSTGAVLRLDGADSGHAEQARGRANHLVLIDEGGFVKDLRGLIRDVVLPSFLTTRGRLVVLTTPPKTAGHYCAALRQELSLKGAFLKYRLSDNRSVTPEVRERWAAEVGGEGSDAFRREYECDEITDFELAVVPEFSEAINDPARREEVIQPVAPPDPHVARVVGMDLGWGDPTGVIFGYYDWRAAKLRIQDEALLRKPRIEEIARAVKAKEASLWGEVKPYSRISDIDPMVLAELSGKYGLSFRPVSKQLKEQMVNEVRTWFRGGRIVIDPRCVNLIAQLEAAIWTSSRRTYEHTEAYGHFDLVDALVYLLQALPLHMNPYPAMPPGISPATHYIEPGAFPDPNRTPVERIVRSGAFWRR